MSLLITIWVFILGLLHIELWCWLVNSKSSLHVLLWDLFRQNHITVLLLILITLNLVSSKSLIWARLNVSWLHVVNVVNVIDVVRLSIFLIFLVIVSKSHMARIIFKLDLGLLLSITRFVFKFRRFWSIITWIVIQFIVKFAFLLNIVMVSDC